MGRLSGTITVGNRRVSRADRNEIRRIVRRGGSPEAVARDYLLSEADVAALASDSGPGRILPSLDVAEAQRLIAAGASHHATAKTLGVGFQTLSRHLARARLVESRAA